MSTNNEFLSVIKYSNILSKKTLEFSPSSTTRYMTFISFVLTPCLQNLK